MKITKKIAKKFKKLKNQFQKISLAKTGCDRPRKGEKNFRPEFRLYWTPEKKFRKKIRKIKKPLFDIIPSRNGMR